MSDVGVDRMHNLMGEDAAKSARENATLAPIMEDLVLTFHIFAEDLQNHRKEDVDRVALRHVGAHRAGSEAQRVRSVGHEDDRD
jgi:hypothetical protein